MCKFWVCRKFGQKGEGQEGEREGTDNNHIFKCSVLQDRR